MWELLTIFFSSSLCVPHIANLCFSVVLKGFGEIHRELLFLVQNVTMSERRPEILIKFVLHNMFEKGQILRKNLYLFKQLFLIKPVKWKKL